MQISPLSENGIEECAERESAVGTPQVYMRANAVLAHLVERYLAKVEATGSSPVYCSNSDYRTL